MSGVIPSNTGAGSVRIASVGELLAEFVCEAKDTGHRSVASYLGPFPSGAPAIFIDQAARLGARCIFSGAVGADAFGSLIVDQLCQAGVDVSMIETLSDRPTGTAFVAYRRDDSRAFVFNIGHAAAGHLKPAADRLKAFEPAVLHISGASFGKPEMATRIVELALEMHRSGVRISFDPNVRPELMDSPGYAAHIQTILDRCTYFLPSDADAEVLFPGLSAEGFAEELFTRECRYVALKQGENGCLGLTPNGACHDIPGHTVDVADPTGAGDCFCATLVTLIEAGDHSFEEALVIANAAGAHAVTRLGPMSGNAPLERISMLLTDERAASS